MEPSFYDQEYLIIDEISYRFSTPERGDVIVFKYPRDPKEYFIKRVIALPGEKVQIKNGEIYIYNSQSPFGSKLSENYLDSETKTYGLSEEIIVLEDGEYYVLGDNRNSSKDSRSFGSVDDSFIIGKVLLRGWPFDRISLFQVHEYQF